MLRKEWLNKNAVLAHEFPVVLIAVLMRIVLKGMLIKASQDRFPLNFLKKIIS